MKVHIRDFETRDVDRIVEILKLNGQFGFPEVDGPEAMKRVKRCKAAENTPSLSHVIPNMLTILCA